MELDKRQRSLRERAEALLNQVHDDRLDLSPEEIGRLVHDLSVYQIELELQNEDLRWIQNQLEYARDCYVRLYHQAPVGYLSLDHRGIIQQANQTFANRVDYPVSDLVGRALADFMNGSDRETFLSRFRAFFNHPTGKSIDAMLYGRNHRAFYARITGRQDLDAPSSGAQLLVIVHDISEQKAMEDALRESRAFQELLLETLPTPVFYKDMQGHYLGCNKAFTDLLGRPRSDIMGKTAHEIAPRSLAEVYHTQDRDLLLGAVETQVYQSQVVDAGGGQHEVLLYKARIVGLDGAPRGLIGVILDITERQRAEEALREQEAILRTITDSAQDAIIMLDAEGHISFWNPAAEHTFGYTQAEALGQDLHQLLAPDRYHDIQDQAFRAFQQTGRGAAVGKTIGLLARRKDGVEIAVALALSAVRTQDQWHAVGIVRDETERQAQERELRRLATTDHLTGLANRRHFLGQVDLELERFRRYARPAALLMIDIDHFKQVNDTWGHAAGDQALQHFARIALGALRHTDALGRLGGEEFGALLTGTDLAGAGHLAERLRKAVMQAPFSLESGTLAITVSIGVTLFAPGDTQTGMILSRADRALYQAKARGRNRVEIETLD